MQRKLSLGGIFLLFLLFFAILSCIHPDTTTTGISFTEDITSSTEETISTEVTISIEETTSSTDTISSPENIFCTSIIDGDTFRLSSGETVRLIGIDAPELSQPGGKESRE
ncbi:MAG: hypothetical protein HXS54_10165 [Theionarchaea archaeon]|nr:hypothetical protein [Theionarchaea archaeon]